MGARVLTWWWVLSFSKFVFCCWGDPKGLKWILHKDQAGQYHSVIIGICGPSENLSPPFPKPDSSSRCLWFISGVFDSLYTLDYMHAWQMAMTQSASRWVHLCLARSAGLVSITGIVEVCEKHCWWGRKQICTEEENEGTWVCWLSFRKEGSASLRGFPFQAANNKWNAVWARSVDVQ